MKEREKTYKIKRKLKENSIGSSLERDECFRVF